MLDAIQIGGPESDAPMSNVRNYFHPTALLPDSIENDFVQAL